MSGINGELSFDQSRGAVRMVDGGGSLTLELALGSGILNNWLPARNALPIFGLIYNTGQADMPICVTAPVA